MVMTSEGMLSLATRRPLSEPARGAGRERADEADPPRRAGMGGEEAEDRRAERHDRGKRKIDLAGDDDEGQRQRDDAEQRRRLGEGAIDVDDR